MKRVYVHMVKQFTLSTDPGNTCYIPKVITMHALKILGLVLLAISGF